MKTKFLSIAMCSVLGACVTPFNSNLQTKTDSIPISKNDSSDSIGQLELKSPEAQALKELPGDSNYTHLFTALDSTDAFWDFSDIFEGDSLKSKGRVKSSVQEMGTVPNSYHSQALGKGLVILNHQNGLRISHHPIFNSNNFTLNALVYPTGYSSGINNIFAKESPGNTGAGYVLRFEQNGYIAAWFRGNTGSWIGIKSANPLPLNHWYNIQLRKASGFMELYVNNHLLAANNISKDSIESSFDIGIGYDAMNQALGSREFDGYIHAIRFEVGAKIQNKIVGSQNYLP